MFGNMISSFSYVEDIWVYEEIFFSKSKARTKPTEVFKCLTNALHFTFLPKEGDINYSGTINLVASFKQCKQVLTWGEFQKVGYATYLGKFTDR